MINVHTRWCLWHLMDEWHRWRVAQMTRPGGSPAGAAEGKLLSSSNCDTESLWGQERLQLSHALVISNTWSCKILAVNKPLRDGWNVCVCVYTLETKLCDFGALQISACFCVCVCVYMQNIFVRSLWFCGRACVFACNTSSYHTAKTAGWWLPDTQSGEPQRVGACERLLPVKKTSVGEQCRSALCLVVPITIKMSKRAFCIQYPANDLPLQLVCKQIHWGCCLRYRWAEKMCFWLMSPECEMAGTCFYAAWTNPILVLEKISWNKTVRPCEALREC